MSPPAPIGKFPMSPCPETLPDMESQNRDGDTVPETLPESSKDYHATDEDPEESLPQGSPVRENLPEPEPAESLPEVSGDGRCGL